MGRFELANYTEVKDRIPLFLERYPEGRILTDMVDLDLKASPAVVVFKAYLYRDGEAAEPLSTGYAYEREAGHVNSTSFIENCETSAIGRALANIGITGPQGAPRPSREEMEGVRRMEEARKAHREAETAPRCPKCGGPMRDLRGKKRSPKEPDFRCMDRSCKDGRFVTGLWIDSIARDVRALMEKAAEVGADVCPDGMKKCEAAVEEGDYGHLVQCADWLRRKLSGEKAA